jgi:FAD/FMN-containing dehydrogenase/Fe-S oxidoreductase
LTDLIESQLTDISHQIQKSIQGQVRTDLTARLLYSTDASIYQIEPLGVIFPRVADDLNAIVEICATHHTPIVVRGAGSSLAGQAIGRAWIVDCSRYLNRLVEINPEEHTALVEPGVVLNLLNREAAKLGLQFGPDPASAERATLGGSLANNASGAHSIRYGMSADHLLGVEAVLSDGATALLEEINLEEAERRSIAYSHRDAKLYKAALAIRKQYATTIRANWPRTWRRASGYNLNYLLPWSPSRPPQWSVQQGEGQDPGYMLPYPPVSDYSINLAPLIAGSEGTLAIIRKATVRLVPLPTHTILAVLAYPGIADACDEVPSILELGPSAIELIPQNLIKMARSVPSYANQLSLLEPLFAGGKEPPALLVVEFSGVELAEILSQVKKLPAERLSFVADTSEKQRQVWGIRKVGLGLFLSRAGDAKPWSFIEDLAVPVERLGDFVREIDRLMAVYGVAAENYGHASAGCLHIRPVINLKSLHDIETMRLLASDAVDLVIRLGGVVSGEHGDGLARSEWNERQFGKEITAAFRLLKQAADPAGLLNPGKIVSSQETDPIPLMDQHLRFGDGYRATGWTPEFDFKKQASLEGAIELCNGAGVCRKAEGVMCPSFQATHDEMYSTRGRANLLRYLITGKFPDVEGGERTVYDALDLCLACKGCKAECPSAVDMAKLKYEFLNHFYTTHPRKLRDYLFGYIEPVARLAQPFSWLVNPILASRVTAWFGEHFMELSSHRSLPKLSSQTLRAQARAQRKKAATQTAVDLSTAPLEPVLFLSDAFTEYFFPQVGLSAIKVLQQAGCRVIQLPVLGAGRTLISKGFLKAARAHASRLLAAIRVADPDAQMCIVGVEPSETLSLYDEYPDLFPGNAEVDSIARRAFNVEEFLIRSRSVENKFSGSDALSTPRIMRIANNPLYNKPQEKFPPNNPMQVLLHGHCYQKSRSLAEDGYPVGVEASVAMLKACGYQVSVIDSGCCGMAGAFGYEKEHYSLSLQVGELGLLPAVRAAGSDVLIAASGVSCRSQIVDNTQRKVYHPIELVLKFADLS